MAGWLHPANSGPAVRNTERTSWKGTALSSSWWRRVASPLEGTGLRDRVPGDAQSSLVRCSGRVFRNEGTVGRDSGADPVKIVWIGAFSRNRLSSRGGGRVGNGAADAQDRARDDKGRPGGWWGTSGRRCCKKCLASDRCLSIGRR